MYQWMSPAWIIHSLIISYYLLYLYKEYYSLEANMPKWFYFLKSGWCKREAMFMVSLLSALLSSPIFTMSEMNYGWACVYIVINVTTVRPPFLKRGWSFFSESWKEGLKKGGGLKSEGCRFLKNGRLENLWTQLCLQ